MNNLYPMDNECQDIVYYILYPCIDFQNNHISEGNDYQERSISISPAKHDLMGMKGYRQTLKRMGIALLYNARQVGKV
jgi:hypothetical protein